MNRVVFIVGALLTVPLLIFLGLGFRYDPNTIESPLVGKPAPAFDLVDIDGNAHRLEDLKGKVVVLNFWATYCVPCVAEHPIFLEAGRRYQDRAVMLGVIYHDDPELIRRFVRSRGAWGPSLIDPDSRVAIAYGVYGVPETYIIDTQGNVAKKVTGAVQRFSFFKSVESLL